MRYVVFSDIHGNLPALEAMFAAVSGQEISGYLFCGDIFGYFYRQGEIIDLLRARGVVCVKGNHDGDYLLSGEDAALREGLTERYGSSYLQELSDEQKRWLASLPYKRELEADGRRVCMVHGSPEDEREGRLYPDAEPQKGLAEGFDVVLMGHTHYRLLRRAAGCLYLNPGSLGQPRDGLGCSYAILDTEALSAAFYRVEPDKDALRGMLAGEQKSERNRAYLTRKIEEM